MKQYPSTTVHHLSYTIPFIISINMLVNVALTVLATSCTVALAAPAGGVKNVDSSLRLIKTSETDAGIWVTEQEKFDKYTSKGIGFFDITDIQVSQLLLPG